MLQPDEVPAPSGRPDVTWLWQRVMLGLLGLLAAVALALVSGLVVASLIRPAPQADVGCGTPPCVLAPLPPAEVVMRLPPGFLPEAAEPEIASRPAEGQAIGPPPDPAVAPLATDPPLSPQPVPVGASLPSQSALLPLAEVEVAKRPEPKKPRDILLPGEIMKPERQNAAPFTGAPKLRPVARPAPPPLQPLRPAEKVPPRPYAVTTTRPSGTVGVRLGPCGPAVPRYEVNGVEVDAFGRPCGPS